MEVVVQGDNWTTGAISCAKLQSNHHHQQTNIQFFLQAGCPSCRPTDSVKALKEEYCPVGILSDDDDTSLTGIFQDNPGKDRNISILDLVAANRRSGVALATRHTH